MKVRIRHIEPEDYEAVREIFAQPSAMAGTLQMPFPSAAMWKQRLLDRPKGMYSLVACVDSDVVGSLSLFHFSKSPRRLHAGEIGMAVHDHWCRKGVGSALMAAAIDLADNWLNLARLELSVYSDNAAAIRLYEKWGFGREGTMKNYAFRDGTYVDALMMARIRHSGPPSASESPDSDGDHP